MSNSAHVETVKEEMEEDEVKEGERESDGRKIR